MVSCNAAEFPIGTLRHPAMMGPSTSKDTMGPHHLARVIGDDVVMEWVGCLVIGLWFLCKECPLLEVILGNPNVVSSQVLSHSIMVVGPVDAISWDLSLRN
ncbi:hypothetical protein QAD02_020828 [Eretmocerus hayati]|uniref:Uncharacterized protein n=1 Tax=Eretmocerus hayati TaxID=131215 RepID=A0ACC2PTB9_9HYME|nr:hypothetical protein QAD02_020828 [Eretmocerus hayati]